MSLPFYRLEKDYRSRGLSIPRARMDRWMLEYAERYFAPVRNRMMEILNGTCSVQQIDETTWRGIWPDGDRRNGSKGYMWCHTSGELCAGRKIIVYYFEPTRGTDHLRKTLRDYAGMIVSDAYSGYYTIEKECGGRIRVAMCRMHCRRYFAAAVMDAEDRMEEKTPEEILDMPAVKGLLLANRVFAADTPLKQCRDAAERKKRRSGKVAPEMEQFFTFVHGIDTEDEVLDPKLREAVVYALNQEAHLRVFLEHGEVPIDNGKAERCFKVIAASRKSSLFSYSLAGAEADAVMHSVVETARANGADVFTYLKYVLEKMPERMAVGEKPEDFMDEMMPWSAEYRDYERLQKERHTDEYVPESNEPAPGTAFRYREIYLRQKAAEAGSSVRTQKTPEKKKTA